MESKVREEAVSVLLSEILQETGVTNISLLNIGGIPDIYLLIRGVRIVVEIKEEGNSARIGGCLTKTEKKGVLRGISPLVVGYSSNDSHCSQSL